MKRSVKFASKRSALLPAVLVGTGVSLGVCLLGAALLAWLIAFEKVEQNAIDTGTFVILPVASWLGSAAAWGLVKQNRIAVWGAHSGILYALLLLGGLPFGGQLRGLGISAAMVLLGGGISLIPGILGHKSGGRKYKMKGFR